MRAAPVGSAATAQAANAPRLHVPRVSEAEEAENKGKQDPGGAGFPPILGCWT